MPRTRKPKITASQIAAAKAQPIHPSLEGMVKELGPKTKVLTGLTKDGDVTVLERDEKGELRITRDNCRAFLLYRRAFGYEEALESVGIEWLKAMIERGYVRPCGTSRSKGENIHRFGYAITKKGVETYKLPNRDAKGERLWFEHEIAEHNKRERRAFGKGKAA